MQDDPSLDGAYALETPDDNKRLYAAWAKTYDADFARNMDYRLPALVAEAYLAAGGGAPVLDVGAGTGLLAETLLPDLQGDVDAMDLSQEMLDVAQAKGLYRRCFAGDILQRLDCADDTYAGAVSSGTFTHGHVGPEGLDELIRVVRPGGLVLLSVNAEHFAAKGFDAYLSGLGAAIRDVTTAEVRIYGKGGGGGTHMNDTALLLSFQVA